MSLKSRSLSDYLSGFFNQDHILEKSYALGCAYLSKHIRHPRFLTHVSKRAINFCVLITYRCTRRCKGCFFLDKLNSSNVPDMDLKKIQELEKSPIFRSAIRVGLLGGDPLMNPNLFDIVGFLRSKGHVVSVTCNSDLLDLEKASSLKKEGLNLLILSYYKDNREKIADFMGSLRDSVFERKRIALACHSENMEDIIEAWEFARQIGVETMLPRYTYDFFEGRVLSMEQQRDIWRNFKEMEKKVREESNVRFTPLEPFSYSMNKSPYCQNALMTYIIGPDFEISPCCQPVDGKYGDIYDFEASRRFKAAVFREKTIPAMCRQCPLLGGGNFL